MDSNIGLRIRIRRKEIGLTQTELANKLGLTSKSTISKIENGEDNLTTTNIKKYAEALETTPSWLMGLNVNYDSTTEQKIETSYAQAKEDVEVLSIFHQLNSRSKHIAVETLKTILSCQENEE